MSILQKWNFLYFSSQCVETQKLAYIIDSTIETQIVSSTETVIKTNIEAIK